MGWMVSLGGVPILPNSAAEFAMITYWELYVAYVNRCVEHNKRYDIDPHHYEMEWNHWLPLACFPDIPIGQWLTLRQHAIASALQSLALGKNCMFGGYKHYLPTPLYDLAWVYFRENSRDLGVKLHQSRRGIFSEEYINSPGYIEVRKKSGRENGPRNGLTTKERKAGIFSESSRKKNVEATKKLKSKRVKVTYPDGSSEVYYSARETSRKLGISQDAVSSSARLLRRVTRGSFKGFLFEYI